MKYDIICSICGYVDETIEVDEADSIPSCGICGKCGKSQSLEAIPYPEEEFIKQKIYIAGPMRGYVNYNFDAFDDAARDVGYCGHVAISPTDMDRLYEGWGKYPPNDLECTREELKRFITRDLEAIAHCDAIYMLTGWELSKGALVEKSLAEFLGLNVYYRMEEVNG